MPNPYTLIDYTSGYGKRPDGTDKGLGYFGRLQNPNGSPSTELSTSFTFGEGDQMEEVLMPIIVPTLTDDELDYVLRGNGSDLTPEIQNKVIQHALKRKREGKSPFAGEGEQSYIRNVERVPYSTRHYNPYLKQ